MAFPIPSHLPRKKNQDVSTKLLSEISETTFKSLSQEVASKWIAELDVAIHQTKEEIHKRVTADLPAFDQQLSSSKHVQERLLALETNVDKLSVSLSHPETGLIPNLISTLGRHATLAQEAADAQAMHLAMSHLAHCKREMQSLAALVGGGRLPDAVKLCSSLESLLANSPPPLRGTHVFNDVQRRFRALKDQADEQLHEAYSRSVVVSASEILVRPSVPVRASETILSLADILASLSPTSLNSLANTLRRDLTHHYIEYLLTQPASVEESAVKTLTGTAEVRFSVFHSPPNTERLVSRVENVSALIAFLNEKLLPSFPSETRLSVSLTKPLTSSLLEKLLVPSLPSAVEDLPAYLDLMDRVVQFEDEFIIGILGGGHGEKEVKTWADGILGHYERKRRVELLERARNIVLRDGEDDSTFRAETKVTVKASPVVGEGSQTQPERAVSPEEEAWGFDDSTEVEVSHADEDGWGFDGRDTPSLEEPEPGVKDEGEDVEDAWGWNDPAEEPAPEAGDDFPESSAWDDPWADSGDSTSPLAPTSPAKPVKTATKLEKLSNKGKKTKIEPPIQSPIPIAAPPPTPAMPSLLRQQQAPSMVHPTVETETYLVTGRMKDLIALVEDILREAIALSSSGILSSYTADIAQVGGVIGPTAPLTLDLYRALYPVHAKSKLAGSPKWRILFSNNCTWLSEEIQRLSGGKDILGAIKDKLAACANRLREVGELWFDDVIDDQCQKVDEVLSGANGFINTTDQDQYDDCEAAVNQVLQDIRRFSQQVKSALPKSKYYQAIGTIVDAALSRILKDVLALADITEVESHKLSELCRIMNSLEGLFVEDPDLPSFVVSYVPSWLKFSYLSELLEASIADISYLFDEGALVDFGIDELVNLLRALFADTPLRTNTINKLMQGHPSLS
ncbi:hypothetical protein BDW22DRAFT_1361209 [Trametopsis cervina]|nr:hypothetical protein BDW22DRAFT_1361209 [Trametopsis cervina]